MKNKEGPGPSRDAAGVGPYARERTRLAPLSELRGWNVASGDADIRSWEVRTVAGRILGHVRELLVDPEAGEVVLMDIDVAASDRRAYLPIRLVEIDRSKRVVRADSSDLEEHTDSNEIRLSPEELARIQTQPRDTKREKTTERVVERKPVVEETVVRRRVADDTDTRL